ncbi:hypothetical protein Hdeb2414_s0007g00242611 [Helianthus debilis subsp. tardiflorus]
MAWSFSLSSLSLENIHVHTDFQTNKPNIHIPTANLSLTQESPASDTGGAPMEPVKRVGNQRWLAVLHGSNTATATAVMEESAAVDGGDGRSGGGGDTGVC